MQKFVVVLAGSCYNSFEGANRTLSSTVAAVVAQLEFSNTYLCMDAKGGNSFPHYQFRRMRLNFLHPSSQSGEN